MRVKGSLTALVLAACTLPGCVSSAEPEAAAGGVADVKKAQFDEETGAVDGLVLDGEELPVPGAQVAIPEIDALAVADAQGRFAMSHIVPGTYSLFAQALGYESAGQRVDIKPGEVTRVQVALTALAIAEPYVTQVVQEGLFGCGTSWQPGVIYSGVSACGALSLYLNNTAYDKFLLEWEIEKDIAGWNGSVFEMAWESNQIAGRGLTMLWEVCSNDAETRFAGAEGESPLRVHASSEVVHGVVHNGTYNDDACGAAEDACNDEHCAFISRVFSTPQTTGAVVDVGITIQQRFTQYHTAFFYEPGPSGYTGIGDG